MLDTHLRVTPADKQGDRDDDRPGVAEPQSVTIHISMQGPNGYQYDHSTQAELDDDTGMVRFEMRAPRRWWPAGMGDQVLYALSLTVEMAGLPTETWRTTLGLTSVRPLGRLALDRQTNGETTPQFSADDPAVLLVNGRERPIHSVVAVDPRDESDLLPAGGDSLLVVRDHFGPDVLYDAADRAGILLVQSVPVSDGLDDAQLIRSQVDRLVGHPCLAGWHVPAGDERSEGLARCLQELDPTRCIIRDDADLLSA